MRHQSACSIAKPPKCTDVAPLVVSFIIKMYLNSHGQFIARRSISNPAFTEQRRPINKHLLPTGNRAADTRTKEDI